MIVITDRTILDAQLQADIKKLDPTKGVTVQSVVREGNVSKSKKLAKLLKTDARIIVTTLQTFPFAMEHIQTNKDLQNKKFAIIADEAHSSQSGGTVRKIYKDLNTQPETLPDDNDEVHAQDFINDAVTHQHNTNNLSLFAFTATPKDKTIQIFGTLPDPTKMPSDDNVPQAFHHYTMKQAIEEGFILNVLQSHAYYETLYHLMVAEWAEDKLLKQRKGEQAVKKWVKQHLRGNRVKDIISNAVMDNMDKANQVFEKEQDFYEVMVQYMYNKVMGR